MGITNEPISRRNVLRAAGGALALPFLESLLPTSARAAGKIVKPPVRMGIFSVTGGTVLESWRPKEVGALKTMPSILRSLEFAKNDVTVLSGLSQTGHTDNLNGHEHCAYLHLTAAETAKKEAGKPYVGVSVDQLAAQRIGSQTFLPSIEVGINSNQYSFRDVNTPVPYESNPRFVYERMFRGRKPVVPNWQRRAAAGPAAPPKTSGPSSDEQSVLDLVLEQTKDLRRSLGYADRDKLDGYLTSVRSVETRLSRLESRLYEEVLDAQHPGPSHLLHPGSYPEGIPFYKISREVESDPEKHGEYIRIMADLLVLAFQTDTTRIAVFAAGSDEALFPGVVTVGYERHCHTLEHQGNAAKVEEADPIAREACRQIHAWYTALFAESVKKMKEIDEGGSTLLDNSILLYTSYMADGGHGTDDYPILLAGRGGGSLKPGRHIAYEPGTPVANLYVEMLERMGIKADGFGNSKTSETARYNGRLPGLG